MSTPAAPPPPAIVGRGLAIRRGERLLFENLDFSVGAQAALLLRGSNGVGKTSLLLAIAGSLRLDAGSIDFTLRDAAQRPGTDMHFLSYLTGLKPRLTVAENLRFWRDLYGGPGLGIDAALAEVGLAGMEGLDAGYLSAGQTKRLSLARLLVSERPVWLLDEPTAALDADGEALVGQLVLAHRATGGTAIIATHHAIPQVEGPWVKTLTLGAPQ